MLDRAFRWRLALMGSGLLLSALLWASGIFATKKAIVIDYGILGEDALGAEVFIDDELAGRLERLAPTNRTGFEVSEGVHTVHVLHPDFDWEPIRVETQASRSAIFLQLDVAERYDQATGETSPTLVLGW